MINFRMLKLSDPLLWFSAGGLILVSFLAIFSSTYNMQISDAADPLFFVKRQLVSLLAAAAGLGLFAYFDYERLKKAAPYFYFFTLLFLSVVLFNGSSAQGAQRWFQIGPFSFQPSELSKLTMIIVLAVFLDQLRHVESFGKYAYTLFLAGIPFLLIFRQPDLGTALVFFFILVGMLVFSGGSTQFLLFLVTPLLSVLLRPLFYLWLIYLLALALALFLNRARSWDWAFIFGGNVAVGIAFPFIWGMLKVYQKKRILTFLNPAADPYGAGYHSLQSIIAIGSGGLLGKGFLQGTQTQLQFIPEQHSDFIFSVIGEEFGFLGSLVVLLLFAVFIWRALAIALRARDAFGSFLAAGIAVMTAFHVLANIGMTLGLLPVVGIPLPFMSFGGSSLFMNMACVGILQNISMRRQKLIF
jgi:rod shape determining protein RodA